MESFNSSPDPVYVIKEPFRYVERYAHTYHTNAKGRWLKRQLIDVLTKEFKAYSSQYYADAILEGRIRINDEKVDLTYIVKGNDRMIHDTIRIEPPIISKPPQIVFENENFYVIDKPPYMTIHTGGGYHFNTVCGILGYECWKERRKIHVLHRIDKKTSGLLLIGKNQKTAQSFVSDNTENKIKKTYYARVHGNFEKDEVNIDLPIYCVDYKKGEMSTCHQDQVDEFKAKQSSTIVQKIWYDEQSDTTLLKCMPKTGRTHQIRVHLKSQGHCIVNDVEYGGKFLGNGYIKKHWPNLFNNKTLLINKKIKEQQNDYEQSNKEEKKQEENNINKKQQNQTKEKTEENNKEVKKQEEKNINEKDQNQEKQDQEENNKEEKKQEEDNIDIKQQSQEKEESEENISKKVKLNDESEKKIQPGKVERALQEQKPVYELEELARDIHGQAMEICLHALSYKYQDQLFEVEPPYWIEKECFKDFNINQEINYNIKELDAHQKFNNKD